MFGRFGGCGGSMFQSVGRIVDVNNFETNPTKGEHRLKHIKQNMFAFWGVVCV